jgi:hypothetical protein
MSAKTVQSKAVAAAKAMAAYLDVSGSSIISQQKKYAAYSKALDALLTAMGVSALSPENERALIREAQKYRKAMRGPGCTS